MIDGYFRSKYDTYFIDPVVKWQWLKSISPTQITFCAALLGLGVPLVAATGFIYTAICLLYLSGYLDTLDGALARKYNRQSDFGTVCDICADRFTESCAVLAIFMIDPSSRGLWCLLMLSSCFLCVTSFLVVGIFAQNATKKNFYYSPGIMERAEAFLFFSAILLLPIWFLPLAVGFCLLVCYTALYRVYQFSLVG